MDLAIQICTEFQLDLLDLEIDRIQILLFLLFLYGGDGGAGAEKGACEGLHTLYFLFTLFSRGLIYNEEMFFECTRK